MLRHQGSQVQGDFNPGRVKTKGCHQSGTRRYQKIILNTPVTTSKPIIKIIKTAHRIIFINASYFMTRV